MNPFNLLISYVIANSRATFYNVPGNQEITNTALLAGMISENPLMSYLIIDNKAKSEGEKFSAAARNETAAVTPIAPVVISPIVGTEKPIKDKKNNVTTDAEKKVEDVVLEKKESSESDLKEGNLDTKTLPQLVTNKESATITSDKTLKKNNKNQQK
ncbi:hypothetical protein SGQ44_10580 [Flavobacterium sp. Fl-77]|uniref:Uncharacterized protein n=1 Tax=Flavobacterium flavipigmentatum TaxID=2893884 RepID=A0AAJ2SD79_9FLAO|nr:MULTISPECIES: hypothetical protein [unclassified Flavobacterium]MDX6182614.1 hypothetical protein [Flavobacterium sp. Fl-33]MDX6186206.1 hypothetical protein [Flavobacterium sp. Fl-77]UFH38353.1 hypothetical protein LNP22_16670 [Flavobacterium sp. F-70]